MCRSYSKSMGGKTMSNYASEEYNSCKEWVAAKIQSGFSWEDVKNLCVSPEEVNTEFDKMRYFILKFPCPWN